MKEIFARKKIVRESILEKSVQENKTNLLKETMRDYKKQPIKHLYTVVLLNPLK